MNWKNKLSAHGHRITRAREQIMSLLSNTPVALSPMQIHKALSEEGSKMGLVSVYRNLELLMAYDLVCVVFSPEGDVGYVAGNSGHHHHIVCQVCQSSVAFEGCEDFSGLISKIEDQTQFSVRDHFLQFYGLCKTCQEAGEYV